MFQKLKTFLLACSVMALPLVFITPAPVLGQPATSAKEDAEAEMIYEAMELFSRHDVLGAAKLLDELSEDLSAGHGFVNLFRAALYRDFGMGLVDGRYPLPQNVEGYSREAISYLEKAEAILGRSNPTSSHYLGRAYCRLGQIAQCNAHYEEAWALEDNKTPTVRISAWQFHAMALHDAGGYAAGNSLLRKAIRLAEQEGLEFYINISRGLLEPGF